MVAAGRKWLQAWRRRPSPWQTPRCDALLSPGAASLRAKLKRFTCVCSTCV